MMDRAAGSSAVRPATRRAAIGAILLAGSAATASPAAAIVQPEPLAAGVSAMIEAALATGDEATIETVVSLAKRTNPDAVAVINALVRRWQPARPATAYMPVVEAVDLPRIESPVVWSGKGEAGASHATGNTGSIGLTLGIELERDSLRWQHNLAANADYQKTDGAVSRNRYAAAYQGRLKFGDHYYVTGGLQWERDPLVGHLNRFVESAGLGWRVVQADDVHIDLDGGPALRQTRYIDGRKEATLLGRASVTMLWKLTETTRFDSSASAHLDSSSDSFATATALTAQLFGPLSTRVSFKLWHETDPPLGAARTNTASRVTFVYSF